jgi:hypothetical protein
MKMGKVSLLSLLFLGLACQQCSGKDAPGRTPGQSVKQAAGKCRPIAISRTSDNYSGKEREECRAAEDAWASLGQQDLQCDIDNDCVMRMGVCFHQALNKRAASRPGLERTPCVHPAAGMCPEPNVVIRCDNGCCVGDL